MFSLHLKEIAELTNSTVVGDPDFVISGFSPLETAQSHDISFYEPPVYLQDRLEKAVHSTRAGAVFVRSSDECTAKEKNYLVHPSPSKAFQTLINHVHKQKQLASGFQGIHSSAVIHESVILGENVQIGPRAVIDQNVRIGNNTIIGAGSVIESEACIGDDCHVHVNVTIREECVVGNRVVIQPGAVIGSCGFGYSTSKVGIHEKLAQVGTVHLEDDVEVGSNTTIDRARFGVTRIQKGTKIDNLVQIAHNVDVGRDCLIIAQVGIAGSAEIGRNSVLAGQAAVVGHVSVPPQTILAARGGFSKSHKSGGTYGGAPAVPIKEYRIQEVHIKNLDRYAKKIKELEKRLAQLEK